MSEARFQVVYDGEAFATGEMDVRELAPSLLAIGRLLEEVNESMNGSDAAVSVRVRADFRKSSFAIDLNIVQGIIEHAKHVFLNQQVKDAKDVLAIAGFFGVPTWRGYLYIKKWLKNRTPDHTEILEDGRIKLELSGKIEFTKKEVIDLLSNGRAGAAIERICQPLSKAGVDEFRIVDDSKNVVDSVTKSDLPALTQEEPKEKRSEDLEGNAISSSRLTVLRVIKPSFKTGNKYLVAEGSSEFYASIEDKEFLNRVQRDEVKFSAHGRLRVMLRQELIPGRDTDSVEHAIEEVVEVIESTPTGQLPLIDTPVIP